MARETAEKGNWFVETFKTIVYALLIAGLFRSLLFQPFWIPSGSMKDTLLVGDFLFVNKMAYGYSYASCPNIIIDRWGVDIDAKWLCGFMDGDNTRVWGEEPQRGDVIVFRHPTNRRDFIKRLVGMPGDKVQVMGGVLYVNGEPAAQVPAGVFEELKEPQGPERNRPRCTNDPIGDGAICIKERFTETLPGGVSHDILNIGRGDGDDTRVTLVPEGHYFFMGDNRDNSADSRWPTPIGVGVVPYENLIGRADRVIFSSAGRSLFFFWTWRSDRFFKAIE
jgi:signal peptidase I